MIGDKDVILVNKLISIILLKRGVAAEIDTGIDIDAPGFVFVLCFEIDHMARAILNAPIVRFFALSIEVACSIIDLIIRVVARCDTIQYTKIFCNKILVTHG
ncbi:hypothetical protein D3C80_1349380 [compost metagenome]